MGTIDGNGTTFPYVTIDEIGIDAWHQLVVVKDREGMHHFYHNGTRVHSTSESANRGRPQPFVDKGDGELVRLGDATRRVGGRGVDLWLPLNADEIREDFLANANGSSPRCRRGWSSCER